MRSEASGWRTWLGAFRPRRAETGLIARVREWAVAALGGTASVSVSEIVCRDASCPGIETIILVMIPGQRTRACKISKPLEEVTEADVREAVAAG
jgi:hypothetical protein